MKEYNNYDFNKIPFDNNTYIFLSSGKTNAYKVAKFQFLRNDVYNFAFGTLKINNKTGKLFIDYLDETNNNDIPIIFNTLYKIIIKYTENMNVFNIEFFGSNKQRENVYNFMMRRYYDDINMIFDLYGIINCVEEKFDRFDKNKIYSTIILKK